MRLRALVSVAASGVTLVALAPLAHAVDRPWVEQIGTYTSLTSPDYTGLAPLRQAVDGQTLGLGTLDDLDGEVVLVGGRTYRVGMDGHPDLVSLDRTTPFAEAIAFTPDASGPIAPGTACADLVAEVNRLAGTDKAMVAVRVRGTFTQLKTRSVPRQTRPYPPLSEVVAHQNEFVLNGRRAVLVGFRTGADLAGVGAPGLHLHGLTADRDAGGHVLSCVTGSDVQLSIQRASGARVRGTSRE